MSTRQYKNLKGLKKENLRDNMTSLELVLTMLAEATTTEISKKEEPEGFTENLEIAGDTRKAIERRTGKPVISSRNAAQLNSVVTSMIEGVAASETEAPPSEEDETQK